MDQTNDPLPKAPVLSYLNSISSSTRMCLIAAEVALPPAILHLILSALNLAAVVSDIPLGAGPPRVLRDNERCGGRP
jgi:hypothetical protein